MPIQWKYSTNPRFLPRKGQLKAGEPFINVATKRMYSADANGKIFEVGTVRETHVLTVGKYSAFYGVDRNRGYGKIVPAYFEGSLIETFAFSSLNGLGELVLSRNINNVRIELLVGPHKIVSSSQTTNFWTFQSITIAKYLEKNYRLDVPVTMKIIW